MLQAREFKWGLNINEWSDVKCSDVEWTDMIYVKWFCFEVKWVMVKFLGTQLPCTLGWPYTEGIWLYCDYFIWCLSCTVVVLTYFVIWGCFANCVVVLVICGLVRVFTVFCICTVFLYCFVNFFLVNKANLVHYSS